MNHIFSNYDIETNHSDIMAMGIPDVAYTDCPWGQGNLNYWRTMNNQRGHVTNWDIFTNNLIRIISHTKRDVFVEMGNEWQDNFKSKMIAGGAVVLDEWTCLYGSPKRPNKLARYWFPNNGYEVSLLFPFNLDGMGGVSLVKTALSAVIKSGDIVLDPCLGKGNTLKAVKSLGGFVIGNELNVNRLNQAMAIVGLKYAT